jgi:S1-C subfamily serine protease
VILCREIDRSHQAGGLTGGDGGTVDSGTDPDAIPSGMVGTVGDVAFTAGDVDDVMLANGRASFSRGVVSGLYDVEKQPEAAFAGRVIETTAAVNLGSDGGPLVDAAGRVVGVITVAVSPRRWQGGRSRC